MVNLLPPEIKHRHRLNSQVYSLALVYFVTLIIIGIGAVGLASYNLSHSLKITEKQAVINQFAKEKEDKQNLIEQAAFIDDRLRSATHYQNTHDWPALLKELAAITPTNIQLTTVGLVTDQTGAISLSVGGQGSSRRSIILFKDKMGDSTLFSFPTLTSIDESAQEDKKRIFTFNLTAQIKSTGKVTTDDF